MANRRIITFVLLAMMLLLGGTAQAQQTPTPSSAPLIIGGATAYASDLDTDLYSLDPSTNKLVQLTPDGFKTGYTLSPDGTRIAYLIAPAVARKESANGNPDLIGVVWDIEVYEIASGQRTRIAAQPDDAKVTAGQISDGRVRSAPVWSPDSSMLAWTEQPYPVGSSAPELMIYSFANSKTTALDNALPPLVQSANGLPTNVAWGNSGIAVFTNDPTDANLTGSIRLYDPQNGLQHTYAVNAVLDASSIAAPPRSGPLWAQDTDGELLLIELANGNWYGLNLQSGSVDAFEHNIELVSAASPDQSLKAEGVQGESGPLQWALPDFSGAANCDDVAIDPAGDALACWSDADNSLSILQNGAQMSINAGDLTQNITLMWGSLQWRVHHDADETTDTP